MSRERPRFQSGKQIKTGLIGNYCCSHGFSEVIEAYSVRWQIELFFKELKSTLGLDQYQFAKFEAVQAWVNCAITQNATLEQYNFCSKRTNKNANRLLLCHLLHCETALRIERSH